jgi:glycosyltransferase involved in cell wall biosynthesis
MDAVAAVALLASAAGILYVLAGYPLLLGWLARRHARPVMKSDNLRPVSILLAVRNGAPWIRQKLDSILALDYPRDLLEIIVISDGSTDETEQIARSYDVRVLRVPQGGKALALNAGFNQATGDILVFTDVRQPLDPECVRRLVACFADPAVGVASGELVLVEGDSREEKDVGLYWRYEKWLRKRQSEIDSVDGATGALYAMRRELAVMLPPGVLLDDVYQPLAAFFAGFRVIFEESARVYDSTVSLEAEFRRKVRTLAGVWQLLRYYPQLLGSQNRMRFHFVSHKLGRLMLPFALITIAISTFFVRGPVFWMALAPQVLVYGLALADPFLPRPLKRFSSPARTFVVLMAAAFCAITILFVPSRELWKSPAVKTAKPGTLA